MPEIRTLAFPSVGNPLREAAAAEGHAQGFAAGYADGNSQAQREAAVRAAAVQDQTDAAARAAAIRVDNTLSVLSAAASAMHVRAAPVLDHLEEALAAAALELAEAILGHELSDHETAARSALLRALNPDTPAPVHTVRLHPADLAALGDEASAGVAQSVSLVADPSLRSGDAVAEYADGMLDARISAALGRARAALAGDPQ